MKYQLSIWDEEGFGEQAIINDPSNLKVNRELNGTHTLEFQTSAMLDIYNYIEYRKIIRLHDLTKKSISSTRVAGVPSSSNNISIENGEGLDIGDFLQVYNMDDDSVQETCTHTLARAKAYEASSYTDETTESGDNTRNDMNILGTVAGDIYYYGDTLEFNVLTVIVSKVGIGDYDIVWEYYNGSNWVQLDIDIDTINGYKEEGEQYIAFETPSDWTQATVDSQTYYWIRSRLSRVSSVDQQALGTRAYIGWYGTNCKIQVTTTNITAGDILRLESNDGYTSESITVISKDTSPLHHIVADVGHVHRRDGLITSPGANFVGKITTLREGKTTLSSGISSGSSVVATIGDTSGFIVGDYCRLHGANAENCLIDAVDSGASTITLDTVADNHSAGIKVTNYSYTLSRMDFTPEVNSTVEYVNFSTFRVAEIEERHDIVLIRCNHLSYDLNDEYFSYYGRWDISFNPNQQGSLVADKVDIDSFLDYSLESNLDGDDNPKHTYSFIKGDLVSIRYSKGKINVTSGGTIITGIGTDWLDSELHAGSTISIEGDSTLYTIEYFTSNTSLKVDSSISREDGTSLRYLIISKSVYTGDIYNTGTLAVDLHSDLITITTGVFTSIPAGAQLGVISDDNTYYTIQARSDTVMKLNKPIARSTGSSLSFWFDKDKREISLSSDTLRSALLSLCETFSDDEWVTWLEVGEDRSINIVHRPLPFGADPTSDVIVRPQKNLKGIKRVYEENEFGNVVIPQGATSGWENAFSGISSAVVTDSRNTTTKIKLTDGDAKKFRAFDAIEILRYAVTLTNSTCGEKTFTIAPGQKDFLDDGGAFTDYSSEAEDESTRNDVQLLPATPAVNDAFYFGANYQFSQIGIVLSTPGAGTWTIVWEYYNGSWTTLTIASQEITDFTETSKEYLINQFSIPSDWTTTTVNGSNLYWVRARVSAYTSVTTQPLAAACYHGNLKKDQLMGGRIAITSGSGSGQLRTIASNSSTVITVTRKWDILPYASTAIAAAKYSNPIHVRGFGYEKNTVSAGARLRRVECKYFNSLGYGTAAAGSGATACVDTDGRDMSNICSVGDYIYNLDDINSNTQLSAWGTITSFSTTSSTNDTINFSGGLSEGDSDDFQTGEDFVVVDNAVSVRGMYRGGIISFLSGGADGNSYELWGNDDVSFITDEQMDSPLPHVNDSFEVIAPAQLVEQFEDDGTYPDYNPGPWVQVSSSGRYFQIDAYNGGRLYICDGDRAGDYYTISDTTLNTIVPSTGWGTQPADGDSCMIIKETDLPLSIAKHDYTPLAGDKVVLLLYETGAPLSVGKYAAFRTYISSGNVSLSKTVITVDDASIFNTGDIIYLGSFEITSDLLFGMNRGSQSVGRIARIDSISGDEITLEEELDTVPQPGDMVELVGMADISSIRRYKKTVERIYQANDITDPKELYFYGKQYLDRISEKPLPTYQIEFLSLYDIDPSKWPTDKYELGDTIRVIDEELGVDLKTIRINKENISLAQPPTIKVEGSNPNITVTKLLQDDIVKDLTKQSDLQRKRESFSTHQGRSPKCVHFYGGTCRKNITPNTFCNTLESNRDGRLTKEGSPIQKIHCQAFTPEFGFNPSAPIPKTDKFYAGEATYSIPINVGEDDGNYHDLDTFDSTDNVDFVVTDVHINFRLESHSATFDVRVKTSGGVDNRHGLIQGDEDGTGFILEYKVGAAVSGTAYVEFWCWGYEQ